MNLGNGLGHLTYSTLVHPTDNWEQLWNSVNTYLPQVKARVAPDQKFGVCLRLAAPTAEVLAAEPSEASPTSRQFFADNDMYLYTANAFVYGVFKKQVIKEEVYEPDWRTEERASTRSTSPYPVRRPRAGRDSTRRFKPRRSASSRTSPAMTSSRAIPSTSSTSSAHLVELKKKTGKVVTLGLEPEPRCYLETTDETVEYFTNHLYTPQVGRAACRNWPG